MALRMMICLLVSSFVVVMTFVVSSCYRTLTWSLPRLTSNFLFVFVGRVKKKTRLVYLHYYQLLPKTVVRRLTATTTSNSSSKDKRRVMDDIACPRCKTTKYRNPSLRLMVNVCGHALCENCVELLFVKGSSACPECHISLRRGNFRIQMFEDPQVEKEVDIRRKVMKDFNKQEDDFPTLREYNDYLEEVENIIFNLTNNVDVEATKKRIEQYKKENKALIIRNNNKLSKQEVFLEELIESEQNDVMSRRQQLLKDELQEKRLRLKTKEALIDELMFSNAPAGDILASHAVSKLKTEQAAAAAATQKEMAKVNPKHFSTGIKLWQTNSFLPIPKQEEAPLYQFQEIVLDLTGPSPPVYDSLQKLGYLSNTRLSTDVEKAGGFVANIACYRALEEAFCGLFWGCENKHNMIS